MKCRESPLLLPEVDAAVSGETRLDMNPRPGRVVTVCMTSTSTETVYLTGVTAPAFSYLREIRTENEGLVDQTGIEPVTS